MKSVIFIDIDSDRQQKVIIGKPQDVSLPTDFESAKTMVNTDIVCMCEALCTLIHLADQNKYAKKEVLITEVIKNLTDMLKAENEVDSESIKLDEN